MSLTADVAAELASGVSGAPAIARRIGADAGLVELVLRRMDSTGQLGAPLVWGTTRACGDGCAPGAETPTAGSACGGCPLAGRR